MTSESMKRYCQNERKILRTFLVGLISLFASQHALALNPDTLCGPQCLQMICKHFKVSTTINEICNLSNYNNTTGTSIAGLVRAAKSKGLPAVPVKLDIDDLCTIGGYSILYVRSSHFVVFEKCKGDSLIIFDNEQNWYAVPKNSFIKAWNGEAIIFSDSLYMNFANQEKKQKTKEASATIKFNTFIHDFGLVDEGAVLTHTFTFKNTGSKPLELFTRTSCGCTAALLSDKIIQPGKTGRIQVEFKTEGKKKGINKVLVMVRSNDPENNVVSLTLTATIRGRIAIIPDKVSLGAFYRESKITREIRVRDSGDGNLKISGVKAPEWISARVLPPKTDSDSIRYFPVLMTINGMKSLGKFEDNLIIFTNNKQQIEIPVKIFGTVISKLSASPARAFFGEVSAGATVKQEITVTPPKGKEVDLARAILSNSFFKIEVTPLEDSYKVTIIFTAPEAATVIKDSLNIYLSGQSEPEMEIPVFARVVAK